MCLKIIPILCNMGQKNILLATIVNIDLLTIVIFRVEFMSKFYDGQGHPFLPFCFKTILDAEETVDGD